MVLIKLINRNLSGSCRERKIGILLLSIFENCADLTEVFIGDTNVITEIIFSDYYRTFLLCILSIGVVFLCEMQV